MSSATVDSRASPHSAGTSARAPPLSTVIAPKLEATILHPTIPSGSMNAQQSQEPLLLRTRTKRSIYPNRSTLGPSETSDRPEMALEMTPGTTILPQGSISTKSRSKGLKRSKKGLDTATTSKSDMPAVKPPMLPQENAISQPSEESARAHMKSTKCSNRKAPLEASFMTSVTPSSASSTISPNYTTPSAH